MSQERKAVLLLVATAVLWSLGGVLIKSIDWSGLAIAGGRSAIGAVVLLAVVQRRRFTWSAPQLGAAAAYAVTVTLFVLANKLTTAANAILLQYTALLWIAVLSPWALGEPPRRWDWAFIAVILGGTSLFFLDELTVSGFWGNVLALITGFSFGCLALLLRKQKDGSPVESIFLGNVVTALACLPFMLRSAPSAHGSVAMGVLLLLVLGIFQLGLAYALYAEAIRHVTAMEAILIPTIEPILNPTLVLLVLGERPGARSALGGAIVLAAVAARGIMAARGR